MKKIFFLLFLPSSLWAYDTYIFRVQVNSARNPSIIKTLFSSKGTTDNNQTFYNTFVFTQNDTNYVLVKITPSNDAENTQAKAFFSLPNVDLWKQVHLVDGAEPQIIDNSQTFPIDRDWSVKISS